MVRKAKKRRVRTGSYKILNKLMTEPSVLEPTESLTPYEQLDYVLTQLENRILNTVARIKSLGI